MKAVLKMNKADKKVEAKKEVAKKVAAKVAAKPAAKVVAKPAPKKAIVVAPDSDDSSDSEPTVSETSSGSSSETETSSDSTDSGESSNTESSSDSSDSSCSSSDDESAPGCVTKEIDGVSVTHPNSCCGPQAVPDCCKDEKDPGQKAIDILKADPVNLEEQW